ncbi:hypothetical protein [Cellulomonas fengjieae]|uniref:Uncharacterized protein n=1 Tax=Cellulomonas fengjieae TaxID=2819978 RepID=A0ABS3SHP2_9CELL|nr:hypothetical protein [Cellulomonas fengjieae]MBO3085172.1 hypothetical protein [Cellulomonas fengjieae]QVI66255.1 hypothetical protein KG102_01100 [Cellulomonas fengjieae]
MTDLSYPPATVTRREFFVPPGSTGAHALEKWEAFKEGGGFFPTTERKIQRLVYSNWRGETTSEVGYLENDDIAEWLTTAIYEPDGDYPFMVCIIRIASGTVVQRNPPILISRGDIHEVIDFLDQTPAATLDDTDSA